VVASSRSPADYAESLLDLSPQGQLSFLPAVVGSKNGLESRIRRIIKDKCGKPNLGLCWAVVVTVIAACITIGAAFAQTRPAETDQVNDEHTELMAEAEIDELKEECEKLPAEKHKNELGAEEKSLFKADLLARQIELLNQQQELQAEQQHLEQLVNQIQLEKTKLRKKTESAVQVRLEQLKQLNALAHQQAEYQKQADIIESEIQILQQATAKAKKHHTEGVPGHVVDKHEHETRKLQLQELVDELRALRAKINNIENLLQATISELYGQTTQQRSQFEQTTWSESIQRQKLIDHRSELEERKSQLKRQLEIAPEGKDAKEIRTEICQIEMEMLDINDQLIAISQQQRLKFRAEYEAKRKKLLPKRRELEERSKYIQWRLKEAPDREDAAQLKAELDEIEKRIREIDFELSSPEWCVQKRKAEQLKKPESPTDVDSLIEQKKSDTSCSFCHADIDHIEVHRKSRDVEAAKAEYDMLMKQKVLAIAELKNRESEWWAEYRAFEADVVVAKQRIDDAKAALENDLATLEKMQQEIEFFTIENRANLDTDIALYNQLQKMKASRDRLAEKIERDKRKLAKYQDELKAAVKRRDKYLKYKPPADTEPDWWIAQPKAKEPVKEDKWHTKPPSQQGQAQPPWQPDEKLQSRINQLQDEIRRLRSEMAEMRKLMKDMVEYEKNRPKPSLFEINKDPMETEENRRIKPLPVIPGERLEPVKKQPAKPLPEIHGDPLAPEKIEPEPSEKKPDEHPPDDISNEPEKIETIELKTPAD
jgi:hypothetical protein